MPFLDHLEELRWRVLYSLLAIVVATLAGPALAHADPPDAAHAQAAMEDYFAGEERGGYVLIGMGVAGLIAGGWLYRAGTPTARGASYPLLGVGVIHLAAGIFVNVAVVAPVAGSTPAATEVPSSASR